MRAHWGTWLVLLSMSGCHSDKQEHEPTSAEATQGGEEDPIYNTPDGTVGPNAADPAAPPTTEGMGPGSGGPPDIVGGAGGTGPVGGAGGAGGVME